MAGTLYIVATPIGNIEEITARALEVLTKVDLIAAEDTRTTKLMFNIMGMKSPKITAYHKFNEVKKQDTVINELLADKNVALVSEAGTPCISDPGYYLVNAAVKAGINVRGVSGPCAAITALSVSGFPAEPFTFLGFLPKKKQDILKITGTLSGTVVFYESPKRIIETTAILAEQFPNADVCLCNDMSKQYELTYRGAPRDVLTQLNENPHAEKGEYTCVINIKLGDNADGDASAPSFESLLIDCMVKNGCDLKTAIKTLSADYPKNELYAASLKLKELL